MFNYDEMALKYRKMGIEIPTKDMIKTPEQIEGIREAGRINTLVLDEVHHAAAPSYQKIMSYFKPEFWLGMTATPDRTDDGNIYELFDHNIVYEIRLQQALENNLLCPFHYFGIRDIAFDIDADADALMMTLKASRTISVTINNT